MTVRVNLLPQATRERDSAARQRNGLLAAGLLLVLLLGAFYLWSAGQVDDARDELLAAEARTQELSRAVGDLGEFRDLAVQREDAQDLLRATLGDEISLAGLLQDLAAVMPSDTQLETLNVQIVSDELVTTQEPGAPTGVGTFTAVGRTLASHAPGVERFLLELDKVISFRDLFVTASVLDEPDEPVATFTVEGGIGTEARTERYTDGLPEELR